MAPQFTYFGQRYVLVSKCRPGRRGESRGASRDRYPPRPAYAQRHPDAGTFHCSNNLLNKTEELIAWGIKAIW